MAAIRRGGTRRWRGARIITLAIAVIALLPIAYVFNGSLASTKEDLQVNAVQRAGVGYMRPLTTLLAALVDAQGMAVRGEPAAADAVRNAIEQVNQVDKASGDPLEVKQRWSQLRAEIESALGKAVSGPDAMGTYAESIGLTQALLSSIGDTSMIARNSGVEAQYLIETAVAAVPDVIVNAGQVAGLAGSATAADPRVVVALDRISRAAQAIRVGPHSGPDQTVAGAASLGLLEPLDEFTAAADSLVQAASPKTFTAGRPLTDLDRALRRVRQAALGLDAAVLDALNVLLERRLTELNAQRRNTWIAGVLILAAAAALLWLPLMSEGSARRLTGRFERPARSDLPDAPERLGQEPVEQRLASVGRSAHALRRDPTWESR